MEPQSIVVFFVGGLTIGAAFVGLLLLRDVLDSKRTVSSRMVLRIGVCVRLLAVVVAFFVVVYSYRWGYVVSGSQALAAVAMSTVAVVGFLVMRPLSQRAIPTLSRWLHRL